MIRKIISFLAAIAFAVSLPILYSGDLDLPGIIVKDRERYYHRLKNMRKNDPKNPEISYQIANLYYSLEMYNEAIFEYRRTLKLKSDYNNAKWFLAESLIEKGYFEEAFWLVRDLITLYPKNDYLYEKAGEILDKMDQREAAKEYYSRCDSLRYSKK